MYAQLTSRILILLAVLALLDSSVPFARAQNGAVAVASTSAASLQPMELGDTVNVHACGTLLLAGQPTEEDLTKIREAGIQRLITLRTDGEVNWDEAELARQAGLEFVAVPFRSPDTLTDAVFDEIRALLQESGKTATMLHCGSANRVGAVWLAYRVLDEGIDVDQALAEAKRVGLRTPGYEERALSYIGNQRRLAAADLESSIRPGINANFLNPNLITSEWVERFEVESREVYSARQEVLAKLAIQPGWKIADVGAGTGFYAHLFADQVGAEGWVFAVDIAPRFLEHINQEVLAATQHRNVTGVLGGERSINLPADMVDLVFVCDTYHHFEYPKSTLQSIHRSLRPGGSLVIVDFERIPGESREWVLNHVRAGKEVVREEVEQAGFQFVGEAEIAGFEENYLLQFRKRALP